MTKSKLETIISETIWVNHLPIGEQAICPVCDYKNFAHYESAIHGGGLIIEKTCQHYSDIVNAGDNKIGFMFWITGDQNGMETN